MLHLDTQKRRLKLDCGLAVIALSERIGFHFRHGEGEGESKSQVDVGLCMQVFVGACVWG